MTGVLIRKKSPETERLRNKAILSAEAEVEVLYLQAEGLQEKIPSRKSGEA
jgi:hypothetical protein